MRQYSDCFSQQARQYVANAALYAAEESRRRADSIVRIRAVHVTRQAATAARRALESAHNFAAVRRGIDYERFVADLLTAAGHTVRRVGGSGDYGADLLAETSSGTAVIQCKFYTHPVGYDAVKEAYTAKALYKATAAFVVTNTAFTPQARRTARRLGVTLTNHAEIAALL